MNSETILKPNPNRFSLYPLKYLDMWQQYKDAESSFWQVEEIKMDQDIQDWKTISTPIRNWISTILAFFQVADGLVCENLVNTFSQEVQIPEARCFFGFQIAIENIHAECYSMLVDTLIETEEKERYQNAIVHFPCVKRKIEWCEKYTNPMTASFAERVVAWACTEMIMFSSSFAAIFYVKAHLQKMNGLSFSNELISRDEGMHCKFACLIYSKLNNKLPVEKAHEIIKDSVEVEKSFVRDSLTEDIPMMSNREMCSYVEFVADILCTMLEIPKIYNTNLPRELEYMETISMKAQANFFERRVSSYSVKPLIKSDKFDMDMDF